MTTQSNWEIARRKYFYVELKMNPTNFVDLFSVQQSWVKGRFHTSPHVHIGGVNVTWTVVLEVLNTVASLPLPRRLFGSPCFFSSAALLSLVVISNFHTNCWGLVIKKFNACINTCNQTVGKFIFTYFYSIHTPHSFDFHSGS